MEYRYWDESKRLEVIDRIFDRFDTCGGKMKVCADDYTRACSSAADCGGGAACVANPKHVEYGATTCPTVAADCTNSDNGEDGFLKIKNYALPLGHCSAPVWSDPDTCVDDADCYGNGNTCVRVAEYTEECLVWDPFADHPMHDVPEGDPEDEKCPPFPWDDSWSQSQRGRIGNMAPGSHPKEGIWDGVYTSMNMYPFDVGRNYQGCVNYPNPVFAHMPSCDGLNGPGMHSSPPNNNAEANMAMCLAHAQRHVLGESRVTKN